MSAAEFLAEVKRVAEAATPGPWGTDCVNAQATEREDGR